MTKLNPQEIRDGLQILLEHAERQGLSGVDASQADLYWTITSGEWLVAETEPKPGVGSLHDDIQELKRLLREPTRASAVDVNRLANVLHLLSVQLSDGTRADESGSGAGEAGGRRR